MNDNSIIDRYIEELPESFRKKMAISSRIEHLLRNGQEIKKKERSKYIEVEFQGNIRRVCHNFRDLAIRVFQYVIVLIDDIEEVGIVTAIGKEAELKKGSVNDEDMAKLLRIANEREINRYRNLLDEEQEIVATTKELTEKYDLDMKVTEAVWQFDKQKLTIFFTAPQRIDFRELVKELARSFKTRIELRQISSREETQRLGPCVGPCGRELCCTTFLKDFDHITLDHARNQQLSNNISKLSGNCGRLKCCLKYEYENYMSAYEKFPPLHAIVETRQGVAKITKIDIFRNTLTCHYEDETRYEVMHIEEMREYIDAGKVYLPKDDVNPDCNNCPGPEN